MHSKEFQEYIKKEYNLEELKIDIYGPNNWLYFITGDSRIGYSNPRNYNIIYTKFLNEKLYKEKLNAYLR